MILNRRPAGRDENAADGLKKGFLQIRAFAVLSGNEIRQEPNGSRRLVEPKGFEPSTSALRTRRSPS